MDLCSVEIIEYVIGYLGNDIPTKMILFLKDDCNIDIQSKFLYYNKYNKAVCNVIYNGEIINSYIFTQNSEAILVELFNIFIKEDKIKIKEKILEIRERNKKNNPDINSKSNKESINIYNNSVNNNSLNNNNLNSINIKTLSDLRSYVENNSNIDNKQEITNLIKELEEAKDNNKDNNKEKDYIYKLLKLLELLGNILTIPSIIIRIVKTIKNFF